MDRDLAAEYKKKLGNRAMDIIAMGLGVNNYRPHKKEASCPFHKDKTPSLKWDSKKMFWKCFSCGESLDIYRYLEEFKGMGFMEAKAEVAGLTGGEIELSVQTTVVKYKKPSIDVGSLSSQAIE